MFSATNFANVHEPMEMILSMKVSMTGIFVAWNALIGMAKNQTWNVRLNWYGTSSIDLVFMMIFSVLVNWSRSVIVDLGSTL
jgi:hypothetical protein